MIAPVIRAPIGNVAGTTFTWLSRIATITLLAGLLIGCAPMEVRVVDGEMPAAREQGEQGGAEEEGARADPLVEGALATAVAYLTILAEACGALVIAIAVVQALVQYLRFLFGRRRQDREKEDIRLRLGRSLAVALEFALAADILKTAVAPSWNIIAQLAAIAVLRTGLNYFLEREIRHAESRSQPAGDG